MSYRGVPFGRLGLARQAPAARRPGTSVDGDLQPTATRSVWLTGPRPDRTFAAGRSDWDPTQDDKRLAQPGRTTEQPAPRRLLYRSLWPRREIGLDSPSPITGVRNCWQAGPLARIMAARSTTRGESSPDA